MLPKKTVEEVLHVNPMISDRMADAIQLWSDMYEGHAPWLKEPTFEDPARVVSIGLPALIASEKARMVTLEMKTEISAPMVDTGKTLPMQSGPAVPNDTSKDEKGEVSGNTTITPTAENPMDALGTSPQQCIYAQMKEELPAGPTERAEFLNSQYKKLVKQIRRQLEYGIAKGGIVIKPYVVMYGDVKSAANVQDKADTSKITSTETDKAQSNNDTVQEKDAQSANPGVLSYDKNLPVAEIEFDFVQADRFFPLSFDANGKVIEAAFIQTKVDKARERVYVRVEYHKLEKRTVTVQNLAFESTDMNLANSNNIKSATNLGKQIPLTAVPEWASLAPKVVIADVDRLLFAYFRMPEANTVDPYSPLGVSGYSRVVNLIKDADMQYSRMLWEFEGGELALDVDRDALKFTYDPNNPETQGHSMLPEKQQRLFRKVDLNAEDTYNVFSPALRDDSFAHGLNIILTRIEDCCGLSRGTLSDVTGIEAKTATELKILKQRSFATNADIQYALQEALEDAIYVMDVYCTLYEITPPGEYEASFEWDDSIIVDSESELSKRITLMQNGLASKLENRMWYFGETENQAKAALLQIEQESTQAMMQNAQAEALKAGMLGNNLQDDNTDNKDKKDFTKSPADKTAGKTSSGKQADSLDNPNKSQAAEQLKK